MCEKHPFLHLKLRPHLEVARRIYLYYIYFLPKIPQELYTSRRAPKVQIVLQSWV